jgi:formylglycine-generating enzyme required for sulfatase activity/HEAT repeat protein
MRLCVRLLTITLLTVPLLPIVASYGQSGSGQACTSESLRQVVEQLQEQQKRMESERVLPACGEAAVEPLVATLTDANPLIRGNAAQALGLVGQRAKSAGLALKERATNDGDLSVRSSAVQALSTIGQAIQADPEPMRGWEVGKIAALKSYQEQLSNVLDALGKDPKDWPTKAKDLESLRLTRDSLENQLNQVTDQPVYKLLIWGQSNVWRVAVGVGVMGMVVGTVAAYGAVFWLRPLLLLHLGDGGIGAIAKLPNVGTPLSEVLRALVPLKYHPRVLDAWVEQQLRTKPVADNFTGRYTVIRRQIHVALPVKLNRSSEMEFGAVTLRPCFQQSRLCLLISGEGGAGKTSLACQIARWGLARELANHAILPILIEQELEETDSLLAVVQGYLQVLTAADEPIEPALVKALLQKRRLLVIVDHLSEMSEQTRAKIRPANPAFPIHALVVTSRLPEALGDVSKMVLEPLRVEGNRLSEFMDAYLNAQGKRHLFEDEDYFDVCRRLSRMVGQRNITVLLARLYADQTIEQQEGAGGTLPDSVPELMLSYLNQLNRAIEPANQLDQLQVQQDAQVIAWKCLERTYQPTTANKAEVLALLALEGTQELAKQRLQYLETRLRLVQTIEPGHKLRIVLDPLAEYLAANYLVNSYCCQQDTNLSTSQPSSQTDQETVWQKFFKSIQERLDRSQEPPELIQGFLLAVRDCCLVRQQEAGIPEFVIEELARQAGLDPQELRLAQEKRRIRLLISELSAPELKYRLRAAEDLGEAGTAAKIAQPNLIGMMENRNQILEARQAAAQTLGKLGIGAEPLLTLLKNPDEELALRRSAAESLGLMKAGKAELLQLLTSEAHPLPIRQGAARAISLIGAASGEAVPMLIVGLNGGEMIAQVRSIPVWREPLTENLSLDLVNIPAGEFLMGSPAEEASRDWYASQLPETEGLDVEAQHLVRVPAFAMSQHPVTQAQWRFVAALPQVDRGLDPDPASHKGDNRPVETVAWYAAMEFCARLSQHTGKTYRLPSEAEWEYACRGGTTTPFHFGNTLSTEIANYNGNYTYGGGGRGLYRQRTTEVGSFGIVNAFGLSDMHGNVYEWCLDHWHPSYEGAPDDGSAWVTDGDDRYRLLRGGSWFNTPGNCRSANRYRNTPHYQYNVNGFRVVSPPPWTL